MQSFNCYTSKIIVNFFFFWIDQLQHTTITDPRSLSNRHLSTLSFSLSVPMCTHPAAEVSYSRAEHTQPAWPLLPGWTAACWLRPHLPCEETRRGPLHTAIDTPFDWKCSRTQSAARPQKPGGTTQTPTSTKTKWLSCGRCGARPSWRDPEQSGGPQDFQKGGVWGKTERHGARAGERWGCKFTLFMFFVFT